MQDEISWRHNGSVEFGLFPLRPEEYRISESCTVTAAVARTWLGMHHALLGLPHHEIERIADAIEKVATHVDELREFAACTT